MKQNLVIDKSIIKFLANSELSFRITKAQKCVSIVEQNKVVIDQDGKIFREYQSELDGLGMTDKAMMIATIIFEWIQKYSKKISAMYDENDIYKFAKLTDDKILFKPLTSIKEINKLNKKNIELEIHNEDSFVCPEPHNRLKNLDVNIEFSKDVYYDIKLLFEPFIRDSRSITVVDPFLPNVNALNNFKTLFDDLSEKNILISTHSRHNYINIYGRNNHSLDESNWTEFENIINDLRAKNNQIEVREIRKAKHIERYLMTDDAKIIIPGGFDFLDSNGFPNISDENTESLVLVYQSINN